VIPWKIVRRQLASVDQLDRRLALCLNRVADEIRADSLDFPIRVESGSHRLVVVFRPPRSASGPPDLPATVPAVIPSST
jgi:hypothetical protein